MCFVSDRSFRTTTRSYTQRGRGEAAIVSVLHNDGSSDSIKNGNDKMTGSSSSSPFDESRIERTASFARRSSLSEDAALSTSLHKGGEVNEIGTLVLDGELLLPILRDISQGMRFLHSANPPVNHGDLKAQNILVDSRFRAKVADFGLSHRRNIGGTGTVRRSVVICLFASFFVCRFFGQFINPISHTNTVHISSSPP
jgi:serine/threonine protein kinase